MVSLEIKTCHNYNNQLDDCGHYTDEDEDEDENEIKTTIKGYTGMNCHAMPSRCHPYMIPRAD